MRSIPRRSTTASKAPRQRPGPGRCHPVVHEAKSGRGAVPTRRHPELRAKAANEVRQVLEAYVEGDLRDGILARQKSLCGLAKARPQQPLMGRNAGHAPEGTQKVVAAQTRDAREVSETVRLCDSRLQVPQHAGNSSRVPRRSPTPWSALGQLNDGPSQLESELLEGARASKRHPGPRSERRQGAKRGKAILAERIASSPRVVHHALEQLGIELKGEAAVAFAVLVRALESMSRIAQKERPRRQERRSTIAPVDEGSGQHERDRGRGMSLFERTILGSRRADDVENSPPVPRRDRPSFGGTEPSRLRLAPKGGRQRIQGGGERREQLLQSLRNGLGPH